MHNDFRIIVFPLTEPNMLNAKQGELIININTGHITIKNFDKYISKTKELEARIDALSTLKNDLLKQYLDIAEDVDYLIDEYKKFKRETKELIIECENLITQLEEIIINLNRYLSQIDNYYLALHEFQFFYIRPFLNSIIDNLRKVLTLQANMRELEFLLREITDQKASNLNAYNILRS